MLRLFNTQPDMKVRVIIFFYAINKLASGENGNIDKIKKYET